MSDIAEKLRQAYHNDLTDCPILLDGADEIDRLREALEWYAEQVAGCRKLGSIGDPARHALDADGGERARAALAKEAGK